MARPRKNDTEKLSEVLPIRWSKKDLTDLKSKARSSHLSLCEFVRNAAINSQIVVQQSAADFELVLELKRSGNNLNQLTKRFNTTGIEPAELRHALWAHEKLLSKVLTFL